MNLWEKYYTCFTEHADANAFYIGGRMYTYGEFIQYISGSQLELLKHTNGSTGIPVGVMCQDSVETFAAIFAVWFSGCHIVPLHPLHPVAVNTEKINQSGVKLIFDPEATPTDYALSWEIINNKCLRSVEPIILSGTENRAYILFTSGSTGKPKGVPISAVNMNAFIEGFLDIYPDLTSKDRFLQTYDLTSDAAFTGYLIPLLLGATVYTIPPGSFKYLSIVKILQEQQITWTQFTPSVLNYLRPYLKSIRLQSLKHSHFGGEALPYNLVSEWATCVPHAEISNIYGPTETTITCTIHRTEIDRLQEKVYNGIISLGRPLKGVRILIIDENDQLAGPGIKGELCIGGDQVMEGYLSPSPDESGIWFRSEENGNQEKYYRSGDLVVQDEQGYLSFCGRKDDQLKISGYRIEPAEIERAISQVTRGMNSKVFGFTKTTGMTGIVAFVETQKDQTDTLPEKLRTVLPSALIPEKIISVSHFPINSNGKIDKSLLFSEYSNQIYE